MNILIVSSFLPFPLTSGGHVRLFNIIKRLAKNHEIFLICEKRLSQSEEDINELKKYCVEVLSVQRSKQWSFSNIVRAGLSRNSFLVTGHTSEPMKKMISQVLENKKIDLIHCETFYVMQNIPLTHVPIVLVEHNIEHQVYKKYADSAPLAIRPLLYLDVLKMKKEEETFWKKCTYLVAVSEEERKSMTRKDAAVVPNGVDVNQFKVQSSKFKVEKKDKTILFIGDFKWIQNRKAVEVLLKEIWIGLKKIIKNQQLDMQVKLWIVGKNIPPKIKNISQDSDIFFDENAPQDTPRIFEKADVLVSPVQVGGGTSFKILEAMASGVPVVTTTLGIEGIKGSVDKDFLLANTTEEFIDQLVKVLTNKDFSKSIAQNARILIEKEYNWDAIVSQLEDVYKKAKT